MKVAKDYAKSFLLEPTKLRRIVDKAHERLSDHQCSTSRDLFEVFLSGKQHLELPDVESVLALENSRKNKILRLVMTCSAGRKGATLLEHEVQVDFGEEKKGASNSSEKVIVVRVRSESPGWPNRTLSELEEQVERTRLHHLQPILVLCGILISALVVIFFQLPIRAARPLDDPSRTTWLRENDLDYVEQLLSQDRPITDAEMREISTRQLRNMLEEQRPKQSLHTGRTRQILLIVIPLAIVVALGLVLLSTCYPHVVFLWGDEVDRYAGLLSRRKTLWSAIISVTVLGLLSKFFATGVDSWLGP